MAAASADLFGESPSWPGGLSYLQDFLDTADEERLLIALRELPMQQAQYYEYTAKRRVAHFGARYEFETRVLQEAAPLPECLCPLRRRVAALLVLSEDSLVQTLVTEYRPGTQLGWHRDALDYGVVAGVSLGGKGRMRFRPYPPRRGRDPRALTVDLQPRSLYVMRDEVRWHWQHSISPARSQRWSVTFRTAHVPPLTARSESSPPSC